MTTNTTRLEQARTDGFRAGKEGKQPAPGTHEGMTQPERDEFWRGFDEGKRIAHFRMCVELGRWIEWED